MPTFFVEFALFQISSFEWNFGIEVSLQAKFEDSI